MFESLETLEPIEDSDFEAAPEIEAAAAAWNRIRQEESRYAD